MNKVYRKIKRKLKGLNKNERNDILKYYEEIINERLDNGESINEIDKSFNYDEIINTVDEIKKPETKNKSFGLRKLIIIILCSPILLVLGLLYLLLILINYIIIFVSYVSLISIFIFIIGFIIAQIIDKTLFANIVLSVGLLFTFSALIGTILYLLIKGINNLNKSMLAGIKKITKGEKHEKN